MLTLDHHITIDADIIASPNICSHFSDDDLQKIGDSVYEAFSQDWESMSKWRKRTSAAMDFAMQVQKDKNFPWAGCANVIFPLITIAAMQFHSRAYSTIMTGKDIVQCRQDGEDPTGALTVRANKISKHMSWQVLVQDEPWEEQEDVALINVPIVGTAFKKSYYSAKLGHNVSELVLAKDFVINYWAKSVDSADSKTHIISLYRNDVYERVMRGSFRDVREDDWYKATAIPLRMEDAKDSDNRKGQEPPLSSENTPFTFLEQHCYFDLDGDGYREPYIVTIESSSHKVTRIVARFDRVEDVERNDNDQIISITPTEYFTKVPFIPSPDSGIFDIGFGVLLGPLNESVNTAINQLFDAGTMANTAGGFLARGAKMRGGTYTFDPFQWNRVDSTGDDLHKSIFPLPVREPSGVLFNLLSLLIGYTNRISGSTDMMVGENPGQNTPAETARSMVEQGQKIYSAIFKRIWRSLKQEFRKLYRLNAVYLPVESNFGGPGQTISRSDYTTLPTMVTPVADPNISSDAAKFAQARLIKEASANNPAYDADAVEIRFLKSLGIDDPETLYKGVASAPQPPPDVKIQIAQIKSASDANRLQYEKLKFVAELQEEQRMNTAKILGLAADAELAMSQAKGTELQQKISAFNAAIGALKENNVGLEKRIEKLMTGMKPNESDNAGRGSVYQLEGPSSNQTGAGVPNKDAGVSKGAVG